MGSCRPILVFLTILLSATGGRKRDFVQEPIADGPRSSSIAMTVAPSAQPARSLEMTSRQRTESDSPEFVAIEESEEADGDDLALPWEHPFRLLPAPIPSPAYEASASSRPSASRLVRLRC